jgi:nitrate reductase NapE component
MDGGVSGPWHGERMTQKIGRSPILPDRPSTLHCRFLWRASFHGIKQPTLSFQNFSNESWFLYHHGGAVFSSLADNALLFVAIDLLTAMKAPASLTPLLKLSFVLFYVLLAAFVGAFADSMPKGRVMFIANLIKVRLRLMFFHVHPLLAYAVVGFGAAVYSPAKYGILTELLPPEKLVAANGWIEGLTVMSIILGTVMGGALVSAKALGLMLGFDVPLIDTGIDTPTEAALCVVIGIYALAACSTCAFRTPAPATSTRNAIRSS